MSQHIAIAGAGFAGTWAAIAATRAAHLAGREDDLVITLVAPAPALHIRPRLYEATIENMAPDIAPLLDAIGVRFVAGRVEQIDVDGRRLELRDVDGRAMTLPYDRFVLATGSELFRPAVPGLAAFAFDVDQLDSARELEAHLHGLARRPPTAGRDTVVVCGGGFTGIETAAEMPARLRAVLGAGADPRVVVVEQATDIGPELGATPRPLIEQALAACGVETLTGCAIAAIDADGVTLADGRRIEAQTVVWTAGARAHPLARQVTGEHDALGRVHVDAWLRAPAAPGVLVAGDVAHAAADDRGHVALMSCQHALSLGRVAGYNAAADLLGLPLHRYSQPKYVTCLDLGAWGALFTEGWDRQVQLVQAEAKALKAQINTQWIYPPAAEREAAFATANPDFPIVA